MDSTFLDPVRPELSWLEFELQGWDARPAPVPGERRWARKPGDLLVLQLCQDAPDIPFPLHDLDSLRRHWRHRIRSGDGGLVSMDIQSWEGLKAVSTISKFPEQGSYSAQLYLPFGAFSFRLSLLAFPFGVRGDRECVALLAAERVGRVQPTSMDGFFQDPYDPNLQEGPFTRSLADDEEWDIHFPDHPLTRVRGWMRKLSGDLRFNPRLHQASPFSGQPDSAATFLARARAHKVLEDWPAALLDVSRAIALDPQRDEAYFLRASLHLHNKRWLEAEKDLVQAIQLQPGISTYHFHLSLALQCSGREQEAVARYSEAQRIDPSCGR